jgi:hypothetical protein
MSELETLGVAVTRSYADSSTQVNGVTVSSKETTVLSMTLPKPATIKATFSSEGLGKKIVKLFKKELQTGDAAFDAAVYISTDTPEATKKFLDADAVRAAIAITIAAGGSFEVGGTEAKLVVGGHQDAEDADTLTIVRAILA